MSDTLPLLFDTDIGSDIDDAVALAYLLKQSRAEIVGITTVSGDTAKRAALCEIVCRAGGREDIPIHAGLSGPLLHGPGQPHVPQFEAVQNETHRTDYKNTAVSFLRDTIHSRPNELTLLAVGPMTNIAALFIAYPETATLLKNIVLMCGVYTANAGHGPGAKEWNAFVDPLATPFVYKHGAGKLLGVGLDVTMHCQKPAQECRERFQKAGGALGMVGRLAEVWFKHVGNITFHDPLAATLLFKPDICTYETGHVSVEYERGPLEGMTRWEKAGDGSHQIARTVNADAFFDEYFGITGG